MISSLILIFNFVSETFLIFIEYLIYFIFFVLIQNELKTSVVEGLMSHFSKIPLFLPNTTTFNPSVTWYLQIQCFSVFPTKAISEMDEDF